MYEHVASLMLGDSPRHGDDQLFEALQRLSTYLLEMKQVLLAVGIEL